MPQRTWITVNHRPKWVPGPLRIDKDGNVQNGFWCAHPLENGNGLCGSSVLKIEGEGGWEHGCVVHIRVAMAQGLPLGECGHCGREDVGTAAAGYAAVGDVLLCHPNVPERPDCYKLVTLYHHPAVKCGPCRTAGLTKEETE